MTNYKLHSRESVSAETANTFLALENQLGFVPNVFAVLGQNTHTLEAFLTMNEKFNFSSLTSMEREIVQIAVSVKNECGYCVAGHSAFAKMQELDDKIIHAVRSEATIDNPKLESLRRFTIALVNSAGRDVDTELKNFISAGYSELQAIDVILGICIKTFSNLVSGLTNLPLDQPFTPFTWSSKYLNKSAA